MTVFDLRISGTFAPDGSRITNGAASGTVDTRGLDPLLDETASPGATCDLAASIGVSCVACPDGSGDFCLDVAAEGMALDEVSLTLVEVADPLSDASCAEEVPFCSCATASWAAGSPILVAVAALFRRRRR